LLWYQRGYSLLVILVRLLLLGLLEPREEGLGSTTDLLRGRQVDVLLAGLGAPLLDDLLGGQLVVVVQLEDLDNLAVVILAERAEQTLGASKEGLFVALGAVDDL
jgi:hypothetical protein